MSTTDLERKLSYNSSIFDKTAVDDNDDPFHNMEYRMQEITKEKILNEFKKSKHDDWYKFYWNDLPSEWQCDRDVALAAVTTEGDNGTTVDRLPRVWAEDRDFMMEAVARNSSIWYDLPETYQDDVAFARSISFFYDYELFEDIFARFPDLWNERETWLKLIASSGAPLRLSLQQMFKCNATPKILLDREVMTRACIRDETILEVVSKSFLQDRDFIETVLTNNRRALKALSHETQLMFPDLIAATIMNYFDDWFGSVSASDYGALADVVAHELWSNRSIVKAWCQAGGGFLPDLFPCALQEDEEVFMWIAEHGLKHAFEASFEDCSMLLRQNKRFMFAVLALASSRGLSIENVRKLCDYEEPFDFSGTDLRRVLAEKLQLHQVFCKILRNVYLSDRGSIPSLLNQGQETTLVYTRSIAEYGGVPVRVELRMIRLALANISKQEE